MQLTIDRFGSDGTLARVLEGRLDRAGPGGAR